MKKNFRKGSGQGPNESQEKGKPRRQIKNARGLRDVLGLGEKQAAASRSTGPSVDRSSTQRAKNEPAARGGARSIERPTERSSVGAKPGAAKKLTYIMNFQPPPDSMSAPQRPTKLAASARSEAPSGRSAPAAKAPPAKPAAAKPAATQHRSPQRPSTNQRSHKAAESHDAKAPRSQHRQTERESEPRHEYRWPKDRHQAPAAKATEERPASKNAKGAERIVGIIKRHPDGFGFLIPDDATHPDIYISRQSMTGVMTNDRVEATVYRPKHQSGKNGEDRFAGDITKVVTRSNKRIVGKYLPVDQKYGVILDEKSAWGADLRIAAKDSMDAQEGDLVAVEITQYPGEHREFTGKVTGLLGSSDDPMNDVLRVIHQAGIPTHFSQDALDEARRFGGEVTDSEMKGREDLTETPLITIDGATARDFDDAIFAEQTASGFRLIVAIADVSHYVKPGTPLDHEAYERGTSTYFPNFVNPMLPEELSNELCSLKPSVTRLCFACEIKLNFEGDIEKFRFFEAVMESKARVTYGEAQEVLDGTCPQRFQHVAEQIRMAADLAKILMQKRFREGSLDLEIPETQVVVDSSGETSDIIKSERLFAHRLIEELMLVTNICTARFMEENEIPGIYRVHEEPDPDNIKNLQRYLWNLGGNKSVTGGSLQKKLTKALQSMAGKPESQILNILTLRTMRQAAYSETNIGHFGLGFTQYSHFTSPIRRYPDLIAHRLIKSQIYPRYRSMAMTADELASATTFLSGTEQRSVKAERNLISIKKARFIRKFVGEEFEGVISSVTKFGVFVLLRQYDVDGLVKLENLGPDKFIFDDENLRLIGPRSGVRYTIGDLIKVRVVGADIDQGKVDFELAEPVTARHADHDDEDAESSEGNDSEKRHGHRTPKRLKGGHGASSSDSKKGKRFDTAKRGSPQDDRGGVRKERVSKRRRKN